MPNVILLDSIPKRNFIYICNNFSLGYYHFTLVELVKLKKIFMSRYTFGYYYIKILWDTTKSKYFGILPSHISKTSKAKKSDNTLAYYHISLT